MNKITSIQSTQEFTENTANDNLVVFKAFSNACKKLNISRDEASQIIGVDKATLSRNKTRGFSPQSKTGELCLQLVRMYRSLFAISGGDHEFMQHWLRSGNKALAGEPIVLMQSIQGLINVNLYLDAMRGKV